MPAVAASNYDIQNITFNKICVKWQPIWNMKPVWISDKTQHLQSNPWNDSKQNIYQRTRNDTDFT